MLAQASKLVPKLIEPPGSTLNGPAAGRAWRLWHGRYEPGGSHQPALKNKQPGWGFSHFLPDVCQNQATHIPLAQAAALVLLAIAYYFVLPRHLFNDPYSTVTLDRDGQLLGATIATDGQWRFPMGDTVPDKFRQAIVLFEDEHFYRHPGINPVSMLRALRQNIEAGHIVSGGSTITMQVIRLSRKGKSRTLWEKLVEVVMATRLELAMSKAEVLQHYAAHAPFGGNVVGIEAAAWRYFGRDATQLSWAEACLLAVLPNQPGLLHPGRNRSQLEAKRNRLLNKLLKRGIIDSLTCQLARQEALPSAPLPLPQAAPHLLIRALKQGHTGQIVRTTINSNLHQQVGQVVHRHHKVLSQNHIYNAAVLVLDVTTGQTLAYIGNTNNGNSAEHGDAVDVVTAPRSSGSILKPVLYAAMLDEGTLLPHTLVPDVPTIIAGFNPQNFNKKYDGAVPASAALARSLNIPAVHMLRDYGIEKLHNKLQAVGLTTITRSANNYGLSLILGGAETKLWDVCGMYASMARTLNNYYQHPGVNHYAQEDYHPATYLLPQPSASGNPARPTYLEHSVLDAPALYHMFEAMSQVNRPEAEQSWEAFMSSQKVAWKTGTSYGFRDGWAVGVTPRYVVGVWTGNADGEGRPGLVGLLSAAPVLFDVLQLLPKTRWFERPLAEMVPATICRASGHLARMHCDVVDTLLIPERGVDSEGCPYHRLVHLDATGKYQVTLNCETEANMQHRPWFVLPPAQEWYYKYQNSRYKRLPPFKAGCQESTLAVKPMDVIYPREDARIVVPLELDGSKGKTVFEVAHRRPNAEVHWHLDEAYVGTTRQNHVLGLQPGPGSHVLTLVDEDGEVLERAFEVIKAN